MGVGGEEGVKRVKRRGVKKNIGGPWTGPSGPWPWPVIKQHGTRHMAWDNKIRIVSFTSWITCGY